MVNKEDIISAIRQTYTTIEELGLSSSIFNLASNSGKLLQSLQKITDYIETHRAISTYYSLGDLHPNLADRIVYPSRSEKLAICNNVMQKDMEQKISEIHIELLDNNDLDVSESLYSNVLHILSICQFCEQGTVPRVKAKRLINKYLAEAGIDILDESDDKTTRFIRAYSRTFISDNPTELEKDSKLLKKEITDDRKEKAIDHFKSNFWDQDLSDKRHRDLMDKLDEKKLLDYLRRLLDSKIDKNALFKRIIGMSLDEFESEIQESYSTYVILTRGFLKNNGSKRKEFMGEFESAFATGGSTGYKIRDQTFKYKNGEKMNYLVVSETDLTRTKVESILYKYLPPADSDDWDEREHYAYILSCDLGELKPLLKGNGDNSKTIQSWKNIVSQSENISKDLLAETLESYLSLDELLAVVPLCFFKDNCPKDVESAFFSNHYKICSSLSIKCIDDWSKGVEVEEVYNIIAEDLDTTSKNRAKNQIQDMIDEVSSYVEEKETRIS